MKIFNRSDMPVDERLWRRIADLLEVESSHDDGEVSARQLTVVVDRQKPRHGDPNSLFGRQSRKKIMIYPCRACTEGTVLLTFLHEIMHEWLARHRPKLYDEEWTEEFCESVARTVFRQLGGKILPRKSCQRFLIESPHEPIEDDSDVAQMLRGLSDLSPDQLRSLSHDQVFSH